MVNLTTHPIKYKGWKCMELYLQFPIRGFNFLSDEFVNFKLYIKDILKTSVMKIVKLSYLSSQQTDTEDPHTSHAYVFCNRHLPVVIESSHLTAYCCFIKAVSSQVTVLTPPYEEFLTKITELYNFIRIFTYSTERSAASQQFLRALT
jgi:hypothetical protein